MIDKMNLKYRAELVDSERVKKYVLGGNGTVTLESDVSGTHHTYSFHTNEDNPDKIWIYTLVTENSWVYVGYYSKTYECFKLTAKSVFKPDSAIVKGVAYIFKMILNPNFHDDRMHLLHEGICAVCGRPLTNPASIELGIGPYCMTKI